MKTNKNSSSLLLIIIFVCLLLVVGISATYAFFSRNVQSNGEETKTNVVTGLLDVNFTTSEYIKNNKTHLVKDEEIFTEADKTVFSVKRSDAATVDNISYKLYLDILKISENFKSEYLKWSLYDIENPTANDIPINSGDFENIGDSTRLELTLNTIDLPKEDNHVYTLFVWLSYSETELQNELLSNELNTSEFSTKVTTWAVTY